jgi:hypothetical protein
MFSIDYLEPIGSLRNLILDERNNYEKYYRIIETYIAKNQIIVGGDMGVDILMNKERDINDYHYELYSSLAFPYANDLVNMLSPVDISETASKNSNNKKIIVFLKTTIPDIKYQVFIDHRVVISFYKLSEHAIDLIKPVEKKSWMGETILVVSPEIQLVDIYRTLYSPHQISEWKDAIDKEVRLFSYLRQRINTIKGSLEKEREKSAKISFEEKKLLELNILKDFVQNNHNVVLLGEHSLHILNGTTLTSTVIQIISQNSLENDSAAVEKIVKKHLGQRVTAVTKDIHVMQDFRIRRTIIKVGEPAKEIMYIYNSANFDLIPFNTVLDNRKSEAKTNFIQMGNPFVLLRFLLIDLWMVRWIMKLGGIDENFAQQRQDSILSKIVTLRSQLIGKNNNINEKYYTQTSDMQIFQENNYIGQYVDEIISVKEKMQSDKRYNDYFPEEYKKRNGAYRLLNRH